MPMNRSVEIEIKLAPVLPHVARAVFSDTQLTRHLSEQRSIAMHTTYYTVPGGGLERARYALRLRREDEARICTFKAPLPQGRLELDYPADTIEQGLQLLLADSRLPAAARALLQDATPVPDGTLRFARRQAVYDDGVVRCLISFDHGQGERDGCFCSINELELELLDGSHAALQTLADQVAARHGLPVSQISKRQQLQQLAAQSGPAINPYFVGGQMLNYCVDAGYVTYQLDEGNQLHYYLTPLGKQEMPARFGIDFAQACAFVEGKR